MKISIINENENCKDLGAKLICEFCSYVAMLYPLYSRASFVSKTFILHSVSLSHDTRYCMMTLLNLLTCNIHFADLLSVWLLP